MNDIILRDADGNVVMDDEFKNLQREHDKLSRRYDMAINKINDGYERITMLRRENILLWVMVVVVSIAFFVALGEA